MLTELQVLSGYDVEGMMWGFDLHAESTLPSHCLLPCHALLLASSESAIGIELRWALPASAASASVAGLSLWAMGRAVRAGASFSTLDKVLRAGRVRLSPAFTLASCSHCRTQAGLSSSTAKTLVCVIQVAL